MMAEDQPQSPEFSDLRITKIKLLKGGKRVSIFFEEYAPDDGEWLGGHKHRRATPEVRLALSQLIPHALKVCEMEGEDESRFEITGVGISYPKAVMGVVFLVQKTLQTGIAWPFTSTFAPTEPYPGQEGNPTVLEDDAVRAIQKLINEVTKVLRPSELNNG